MRTGQRVPYTAATIGAAVLFGCVLFGTPAWSLSYYGVATLSGSPGPAAPFAGLIKVGDALYGTSVGGGSSNCAGGCGTVFRVNPRSGVITTLYSFQGGGIADGANPYGVLINVRGTLYGTTLNGGSGNAGTVFKVNPQTGATTVLHAFTGRNGDGANPQSGLINVGGSLYGTTSGGGLGFGTVFKANPETGATSVVHSFKGRANGDGANPTARLINFAGTLYGTTSSGGSANLGTVFALNRRTGAASVVYSFQGGNDGGIPVPGLINVGGTLYGTTSNGGGSRSCIGGCGTVFRLDPTNTSSYRLVYSFTGRNGDGINPSAPLIDVDGILYGTTLLGGSPNCSGGCGTVFRLDPTNGSSYAQIYAFTGTGRDGANPFAPLTNLGGTLYGTTLNGGGPGNPGTVFVLTP